MTDPDAVSSTPSGSGALAPGTLPPPPDVEPASPAVAAPASSAGAAPPAATIATAARSGRWRVTWYIGLSALLPLAGIAGAMLVATPALKQQLLVALMIYMALTVAFTGGVRWGAEVIRAGRQVPVNRRLFAAGLTLMLAFATVLVAPLLPGALSWQGPIVALGLVAMVQLGWDGWSAVRGRLPAWVGWFRLVVTAIGFAFLSLTWWAALRVADTPPAPPTGFGTVDPADLGSPEAPDAPPVAPPAARPEPATAPASAPAAAPQAVPVPLPSGLARPSPVDPPAAAAPAPAPPRTGVPATGESAPLTLPDRDAG